MMDEAHTLGNSFDDWGASELSGHVRSNFVIFNTFPYVKFNIILLKYDPNFCIRNRYQILHLNTAMKHYYHVNFPK